MENRKIASATHNIRAHRFFCPEKQVVIQDCDDDGEAQAGPRLLHLLQVCVFETRTCSEALRLEKFSTSFISFSLISVHVFKYIHMRLSWCKFLELSLLCSFPRFQLTKCMNVVVVVSRWYGGTLLGPDRFKHINNAARQVLSMGSFLDTESSVNAEGSSNAKGKKRN